MDIEGGGAIDCLKVAKPLVGMGKFFNKSRQYKNFYLYFWSMGLSLLFKYAFPIYVPMMAATISMYFFSHSWKGRSDSSQRWNKTTFALMCIHTAIHYPLKSFYTMEDAPLLWCDKLLHLVYGVCAYLYFKEKEELFSYDPAVRFFNKFNQFVFIPGCCAGLFVSAVFTNTMIDHWFSRTFAGYCYATGTAMLYTNCDVDEDTDQTSCRYDKVTKKGKISCHGWQIIFAFSFAFMYIFTAGSNAVLADVLETDWEYALHLYVSMCVF